ncbi:MAG: SDR family oxidoreductase [Pseudomonadota bacterium]
MTVYPSLRDLSVFITGGATGIGAAMVRAFAQQGAQVGFIDVDAKAAAQLTDSLQDAGGRAPWFERIDVREIPALQRSIDAFVTTHGAIRVLINNVANDQRHSPDTVTEDTWRDAMSINLDPAFFAAQAAYREMARAGGGAIINFSSINAHLGPANMPAYVTAKAGLLGMTRALARDYGSDAIRVNCISPGWVVTPRQLDTWLTPEAEAEWMQLVALQRRIQPDDVAKLALFLASDDSALITGQEFIVDGGRT